MAVKSASITTISNNGRDGSYCPIKVLKRSAFKFPSFLLLFPLHPRRKALHSKTPLEENLFIIEESFCQLNCPHDSAVGSHTLHPISSTSSLSKGARCLLLTLPSFLVLLKPQLNVDIGCFLQLFIQKISMVSQTSPKLLRIHPPLAAGAELAASALSIRQMKPLKRGNSVFSTVFGDNSEQT